MHLGCIYTRFTSLLWSQWDPWTQSRLQIWFPHSLGWCSLFNLWLCFHIAIPVALFSSVVIILAPIGSLNPPLSFCHSESLWTPCLWAEACHREGWQPWAQLGNVPATRTHMHTHTHTLQTVASALARCEPSAEWLTLTMRRIHNHCI